MKISEMEKATSTTECPACGTKFALTHSYEKKYRVDALERDVSCRYASCPCCGFLFVANPLDSATLQKYYECALTLRKDSVDSIELGVFHEQYLFMNLKPRGQSSAVLEIGCDTAQFLDYVAKQGRVETYYLEYSKAACEIIEKKGIHKKVNPDSKTLFDCIVARHVLEHISEPLLFLREWSSSLSESGHFFIEVPDWTFLDNKTDRLTFEHLNHFTLPSLSILLDRAGLAIKSHAFTQTPGYHTSSGRVLRILANRNPALNAKSRSAAIADYLSQADHQIYAAVRKLIAGHAGKKIAFYAASWLSSDFLLNAGIDPKEIAAVFDIDVRKQGKLFHGVPVCSPKEFKKINPDLIIINSSYFVEIENELRALGYKGEIYKTYGAPDSLC